MEGRDVYEWKLVHNGNGRSPNIRTSGASWNYRNALWIVCGAGSGTGKSSEVWKYDLSSNLWTKVDVAGDSPPSRDGHSGTYIGNGKFVIFGGQGFAEPNVKLGKEAEFLRTQTYWKRDVLNDLWQFDCDSLQWTPIYPDGLQFPMGRRGHSCVFVKPASGARTDRGADSASDAMSYAGSVAFTASTNTHNTSMAHASQQHQHHGNEHHHQQQQQRGAADTASHHTSRSQRDTPAGVAGGAERIPDGALLVFGGAGIELSKFTELLYSDLWAYSFGTNVWTRHSTRGMDPPPLSDHRALLLGEHMLVLGGLCTHDSQAQLGGRDILSLHLPSSTWSTIVLSDSSGSGALGLSMSLHGFSLAADPASGKLFVFGGNDVIDPRLAATAKTLPRRASDEVTTFAVALKDRVLSPVFAEGAAPERRYGHMTFPGTSADDERPPSPSPMDSRFAQLRQPDDSAAPRVLLYVFGGCSTAQGGYCDPALYALTHSYVATPSSPHRTRSAPHSSHHHHHHQQPQQQQQQQQAHNASVSFCSAGFDDFEEPNGIGGRSIWDNLQQRSAASAQQPSTWQEIKLSLTASHSERVFDFFQPAEAKASASSPNKLNMSKTSPGRGGGRAGGSLSPQKMLALPEFGVRSVRTSSRGSPMSPWHLPNIQQQSLLSPSASSPLLMQASSMNGRGGHGESAFSSPGPSMRRSGFGSSKHSASAASLPGHGTATHRQQHSAHTKGPGHGHHHPGLPSEEAASRALEERRKRIGEIKQTLKPLIQHQTKVSARDKYNQLFPCNYPAIA